jgi:hypothetical protein
LTLSKIWGIQESNDGNENKCAPAHRPGQPDQEQEWGTCMPLTSGTAQISGKELETTWGPFDSARRNFQQTRRKDMRHLQYWIEGNGGWFLMKHPDGSIVKIEESIHDLAIAQGCVDLPTDEFDACEISEQDEERLGL